MIGVQPVTAPTTMSAPVSARAALDVSVMKMEQDGERAKGEAKMRLMAAAAEVQLTGKGGRLDVTG